MTSMHAPLLPSKHADSGGGTGYQARPVVPDAVCTPAGASSGAAVAGTPSYQRCPRFTREKLAMLLVISFVAVVLLLLQCVRPGVLSTGFCCRATSPGESTAAAASFPGHQAAGDYEYEYDEGVEGSERFRYHHTKRRFPHAIIIGVRKGGTRALLEFLNLHPNIQAAKKEMHFFDHDDTYSNGLEWYRKRMPFSFTDQLTIEKTPAYFTSELVPERMYKMNQSVRLLVVIRDPVERAISDYTQIHSNKLEKGREHEPFEELVLDENGDVQKSYAAIRRSIYHRHMERWLQFFPLKQFHFVSSENLVNNPVEELKQVEKFLGIDHKLDDNFFYFNKTKGFYCIRNYGMNGKEKCLAKSKGRIHPLVNPAVMAKLRTFFAPHNERFFDLIDRTFEWNKTDDM